MPVKIMTGGKPILVMALFSTTIVGWYTFTIITTHSSYVNR
jgi:hypothetical protein